MDVFTSASGGSDDRDDVGYSRRRPTRATKTTNPEAVSPDGAEEMSRKQSKSTSSAPAGCRACSDFKAFVAGGGPKGVTPPMKQAGKEKEAESEESRQALEEKRYFARCPLDVGEIGRRTWGFMHTMSVYLPEGNLNSNQQSELSQFVGIFSRLYPCDHCAQDFRSEIKKEPPVVETGRGFAQWLCRQHNLVNLKLGKSQFDCNLVYERWRDGPKDGSCD